MENTRAEWVSRYSITYHGLGHLLGKNATQRSAIDMENKANQVHKKVDFERNKNGKLTIGSKKDGSLKIKDSPKDAVKYDNLHDK